MPNRLAHENSPYLLQHAGNPVDWYPWGAAALARAAAEDKPIFLSIGYSACHWCHVMEHESFENPAIAALLNELFVCIKVDREERPDLDAIYMQAVQLMTGRGGWPMSVFLTPACEPFYGGTYFPPTARHGMPGFDQVLRGVAEAWQRRRPAAVDQGQQLTAHVRQALQPAVSGTLGPHLLPSAAAALERSFDHRYGGFGPAPKFPHPTDLRLLLRLARQSGQATLTALVTKTLDCMAAGGIYDQLGGGFHRYSVDERWLVPHFEKMLYDNALLTACYVEAFLATGQAAYARVARETCDYLLRDMTDPAGGFYSAQDADSEGVEGKFYVWTPAELAAVLGDEAARTFAAVYDVSEAGNFEHANILHRPKTLEQSAALLGREPAELAEELDRSRARLLAARAQRVPPGLDDKVLVSWNALAIEALAQAAGALDEPRYLAAAQRAAEFLLRELRTPEGRLLHTWRRGQARLAAYLDDYAALANALVGLYQADFDPRWLAAALQLADELLRHFADSAGGFFFTADDHEELIARHKDVFDSATPSGNALAATALVRLGKLCGGADLLDAAERTLASAAGAMERAPSAAGQMLLAWDLLAGPTHQIALVGRRSNSDTAAALADLARRWAPNKVVALVAPEELPLPAEAPLGRLFAGKQLLAAEPTVYVCEDFACQAPAVGLAAALATWQRLAHAQA